MPQFERRLYEPSDDMRAFDSDDDIEDEGSRLPLLIGIALVVLLSFAGVVWLAYTQGVQRGRADAPRMVSTDDVRPGDRKPTPFSKLKIYQPTKSDEDVAGEDAAPPPSAVTPPEIGRVKGASPAAQASAPKPPPPDSVSTPAAASTGVRVTPPPTKSTKPVSAAAKAPPRPFAPVAAAKKMVAPSTQTMDAGQANPSGSAKPATEKAALTSQPAAAKGSANPSSKTAANAAQKTASINPATHKQPAALAAAHPAGPAPKTATASVETKNTTEKAAAAFVLQIGSYKSDAEANASWQTYKAGHSSVAGYAPDVRKVDLGAKGTWYRLRIGPFSSLGEASAACAKLKAQGGNCFPAKQ